MPPVDVGLIFSATGPYTALGRSARDGARMALDEVAREGRITLRAVEKDPGGDPRRYEAMTDDLLHSGRIRHVVGAITSWSRKDMIPVLERHGAMLWYPCPYEGFECNDHVVYLGASPNQHIVPLIAHMADCGARSAFLVGSNYVWGWETLRLARDRLGAAGMACAGERYMPLGQTACDRIVDEIAATRPDVIVNSLIGESNAAFMRALAGRAAGLADHTVVSCNQTEADLADLGPAADGMLSIGPWFETLGTAEARAFRVRIDARDPTLRASAFFATAYTAVHLLADAIAAADTDMPSAVIRSVTGRVHDTVLGPLRIDPATRHADLTPRLACARDGRFEVLRSAAAPVAADPYLTGLPASGAGLIPQRPPLRIVQ